MYNTGLKMKYAYLMNQPVYILMKAEHSFSRQNTPLLADGVQRFHEHIRQVEGVK